MLLHATATLVILGLLAAACGSENKKGESRPIVHAQVEGQQVITTPAPTPAPNITPAPEPAPEPAAPLVPPIHSVTPQLKPSLPPARALTEAEILEYLTNKDSFIRTVDGSTYPRGWGFDTKKNYFRGDCMQSDSNGPQLTFDTRPRDEYAILPLTSARQMKEALGFQGSPLYMTGRFDTSRSDQIAIVAIAKKIRKVEIENSMILRSGLAGLDDESFTDRCAHVYKKGDIFGHVYYAVLWLDLNAETMKEGILSRLIDSGTLGTYQDLQTFSAQLQSLKRQLSNTDTLTSKGVDVGSNFTGGIPLSYSFDFSPMLKAWSEAADQVELAKVPEIGSVFGSYPDRSTPADLTGGTSQ